MAVYYAHAFDGHFVMRRDEFCYAPVRQVLLRRLTHRNFKMIFRNLLDTFFFTVGKHPRFDVHNYFGNFCSARRGMDSISPPMAPDEESNITSFSRSSCPSAASNSSGA